MFHNFLLLVQWRIGTTALQWNIWCNYSNMTVISLLRIWLNPWRNLNKTAGLFICVGNIFPLRICLRTHIFQMLDILVKNNARWWTLVTRFLIYWDFPDYLDSNLKPLAAYPELYTFNMEIFWFTNRWSHFLIIKYFIVNVFCLTWCFRQWHLES